MVEDPRPQLPKLAVLAEAEEPISVFRSGNDLMAVSINGDERDFLSPSYPNVARISGDSCHMLRGEKELPPYGRLTLNFDTKKRWGVDWGSPQADGPPNEGRGVVAGAGVTKQGLPWVLFWTSKRFKALGAVEIYVRIGEKWTQYWSKTIYLKSILAAANVDESSEVDILAIEAVRIAEKALVKTFVHQWKLNDTPPNSLMDSHSQVAVDCVPTPDEISTFANLEILSLDVDPDSQFVIEHIAPNTKQVTRSVHPGLFERWAPWTVQAKSAESFILWRVGQPTLQFQQVGQAYVATVAVTADSRVERFLAAIPNAQKITVLANGRPIALVPGNNKWRLVSDEPVKEPCKFPWHEDRPRYKWPGWQ
jgi:hypothetical protein